MPVATSAELLAAALDADEVADSELEAVDHALASISLHEDLPGPDLVLPSLSSKSKGKALMSVDDAQAKLNGEILKVLAEKFKGRPTQMRYLDERDQIF